MAVTIIFEACHAICDVRINYSCLSFVFLFPDQESGRGLSAILVISIQHDVGIGVDTGNQVREIVIVFVAATNSPKIEL